MIDFWTPIISSAAAITCTAIYNMWIKKELDQKIEAYKIAYTGVFKEKLEIYKELINSLDNLKDMTIIYGHGGKYSEIDAHTLRSSFNEFIRANNNGSIFYNDKIKNSFNKIIKELQDAFDASFKVHFIPNIAKDEEFEAYLDKLEKITNSSDFIDLKTELIKNIKEDLGIK